MKVPLSLAIAGLVAFGIAGSAAAATSKPTPWPFNTGKLPNPALGLMSKVDGIKVAVGGNKSKLLTITVEATAPREGYSDLTLVGRPGPKDDQTFAFDARGRPPENMTAAAQPTPVTVQGTFANAPVSSVKTVEIYAEHNCIAYSVVKKTTGPCRYHMPHAQANDLL